MDAPEFDAAEHSAKRALRVSAASWAILFVQCAGLFGLLLLFTSHTYYQAVPYFLVVMGTLGLSPLFGVIGVSLGIRAYLRARRAGGFSAIALVAIVLGAMSTIAVSPMLALLLRLVWW